MFTLNSSCNMKKIFLLLTLNFLCTFIQGQDLASLQVLNDKSKTQFIKVEALDQLMISLRQFESSHGNGIDSLLLDSYRNISKGYSDNNHFRQGYEVYNKYLNYKIESLQLFKNKTIATSANSISNRNQKDNSTQVDLQNNISQLQIDIDQLDSKRSSLKKYFSFGVIILSMIFAGLLVNYGVNFTNLKSKIKENTTAMLVAHRYATLGKFSLGYQSGTRKSIENIESGISQIKSELKNSSEPSLKKADLLCASILKSTAEIKTVEKS